MSDIIIRDGIRSYLLQIVRERTGVAMDPTKAVFSDLTLVDPTAVDHTDPDKFNSQVRIVQGASGDDPEVSLLLQYYRLSLSKLFDLRSKDFTLNPSFTNYHDYLPAINARLGSALTAEDITAGTLTGAEQTFSLSAPASSLYAFGTVTIRLVNEEVPEEEDEMYYTLIPPEVATVSMPGDNTRIALQIGSGCGYPSFLKSSLPTELVVKYLSDVAQLSELTLVSGDLYAQPNTISPDLLSSEKGTFTYFPGDFMPYSSISSMPDSSNALVKVGTFGIDQLNTYNDRLTFATIGTDWNAAYAQARGKLLMWRAVLSHPDAVDANGKPALIYWNTVIPLDIAGGEEDDEMYYNLIASDMSFTLDEPNRQIDFRFGQLDNNFAESYLVSSDQTDMSAISVKDAMGDFGEFAFVEGNLYAVNEGSPEVVTQTFTSSGTYADMNVQPSSAVFQRSGGEAGQPRWVGELVDAFQGSDRFNLRLRTNNTDWWNNYDNEGGQLLLIKAQFTHPDYNSPSGQPLKIWYNGYIKLELVSSTPPQV
ncbi:hypothetical protein [Xanthomonas phage RTH11]|nr:hypothetical protein [Xanthomonas phage RTH11]